jgi:aldehyde:ferredoxin oxidoreductase
MYGWMGKILNINLTNSEISNINTKPYAEKYLGGRGIASRIYWERVNPETGAFDPENHLIFVTGPLVATGAQGATRMAVAGKSPMAYPEQYCYGNIGGHFPAELKKAGYDGLVISGCAQNTVYLLIEDDKIKILDASHLWGTGTYGTNDTLQRIHGDSIKFLTTGQAGENRIRSAVIFGSHQSTSTAGFGAVMGSKNLKAIVVKGSGRPRIYDSERLKDLNRYTIQISKRLDLSIPPDVTMSNHGHLLERIGKGQCYQCGLVCIRNKYRYGKRDDLVDYRRCEAMEYYMPWKYGHEDEPVDTFYNAPISANDYAICTFELRSMINWLYECYRTNSLTEEETGLPLSKIGTGEFLEKLLYSITYREGIGKLFAEGLFRASKEVPEKARDLLNPGILPVGENDAYMPRSSVVHALLDPMEPRMSRPLFHAGFARAARMTNMMNPEASSITEEVYIKIAEAFWGSKAAADAASYEGKALAAVKIQNRAYLEDSLGLCDSAWPISYSFSKPGSVGDPDLEAKIFEAVTGISSDELDPAMERVSNIQRLIMIREGRKLPESDYPYEGNYQVKKDLPGKPLNHEKYLQMLKEYYRLRGWDENTGIPLDSTLEWLGMDGMISG